MPEMSYYCFRYYYYYRILSILLLLQNSYIFYYLHKNINIITFYRCIFLYIVHVSYYFYRSKKSPAGDFFDRCG